MNRRHFLLNTAKCLPCCLLPNDFVRRAAAALEAGDRVAGIAAPARASTTLYAINDGYRYMLALDSLEDDPLPMSWAEWADRECLNAWDDEEMLEYAIDQGLLEPEQPLTDLFQSPEDEVSSCVHSQYLDWGWPMNDCPQARAFHWLSALSIGNSESEDGACLGELSFVEGSMPGCNDRYVETYDELVLPCLQRRLLELGEDVRVEVG